MTFAVLLVHSVDIGRGGEIGQFGLSAPRSLKDRILSAASHDKNVPTLQDSGSGNFSGSVPLFKLLGWIEASGYVLHHFGPATSSAYAQYIFKQVGGE